MSVPPLMLRVWAALSLVLDAQMANASEDALLRRAGAATTAELAAAHVRLLEIERSPVPTPIWRQRCLPDGTRTWTSFDPNRLRNGLFFDINGRLEVVEPKPLDNARLSGVVELPSELAEAVNRGLHLDLRYWVDCGPLATLLLYLSVMKRRQVVRRDLRALKQQRTRMAAEKDFAQWEKNRKELLADDAAGYEREICFEDGAIRSRLAKERNAALAAAAELPEAAEEAAPSGADVPPPDGHGSPPSPQQQPGESGDPRALADQFAREHPTWGQRLLYEEWKKQKPKHIPLKYFPKKAGLGRRPSRS